MERQDLHGRGVFLLHPVLTEEECGRLIAQSEEQGYTANPAGFAWCRCAAEVADLLYERVAPALEAAGRRPRELAPEPTFCRFEPGQRLLPGWAPWPEAENEVGQWCNLHLYLNGGYGGGETVCYLHDRPLHVEPRACGALVFPTHLPCEELPVRTGRKYLLRLQIVCAPPG